VIYWLLRYVTLGPLFKLAYRPRFQGLENVPTEGPVILAANHLSFIDSLFIPLGLKRHVTFLGKAEYFDKRRTAWFFKMTHVIPIRRDSGSAAEAALRAGLGVLEEGNALGIYPEGTRSPDGRLYRGKTGVARLALESGVPVIPLCLFGTRDVQPPGQRSPKLTGRVRVVFGKPLTFERYAGQAKDRFAVRAVTDEIMYEIMSLSGQEYVDEYASKYRARVAREAGEDAEGVATPGVGESLPTDGSRERAEQ
jgi:1-acyl-sn-glycerol-3-phosphate acyltransferase